MGGARPFHPLRRLGRHSTEDIVIGKQRPQQEEGPSSLEVEAMLAPAVVLPCKLEST